MEARKKSWRRQILKIACAETIYELWKERNEKIFSQIYLALNVDDKIIDIII